MKFADQYQRSSMLVDKKYWNDGMLEYWEKDGKKQKKEERDLICIFLPLIPLFQYSGILFFHYSSFLFFHSSTCYFY